MKNKSLLIATPTRKSKDYCEKDYLEGILSLDIPDGWDLDFFILENTEDVMDTSYFKALVEQAKALGLSNMTISHVGINNTINLPQRVTLLYNYIRGYHNYFGFTRTLIVESDVIFHQPDSLKLLMSTMDQHSDAAIVSGVTEYEKKLLTPEQLKELRAKGTIIPDIKEEFNTMIYKRLSLDETKLAHTEEPLAFWMPPDKTDWINIKIPLMKSQGFIIDHDMYSHDEIKALKEPFEVPGCPLGCCLVRGTVLTNTPFRYNPFLGVFNDVLFPIDVRKSGWKIYCDPRVWPEHRARAWDLPPGGNR